MTTTMPADTALPEPCDPETLAAMGVAEWLRQDDAAAEEHGEAIRADIHRLETQRSMQAAGRVLSVANARVSSLMDKLNVDGRRTLGFFVGGVVVATLMILDVIPLNWAAQAFGLNNADSWVVTAILLVASVGAMVGLETTRHDTRRRGALLAVMLAAYAGLVALRTSFLVTVVGETLAAALLQAVVLSAVSAGLVVIGAAVMARTRSLRLSRALAAAQRARRASEASEDAWRQANDKLHRYLSVLRRRLTTQPLYSSVPPRLTHREWVAALDRMLRAEFAEH
jgi:hypothetical protein